MELMLNIPVPPSNNRFARATKSKSGKIVIYTPEDVKKYRNQVCAEYLKSGKRIVFGTNPLIVDITAYLKVMTRDVDNIPKEIFDSLTAAGVWHDDKQIVEMRCRKYRAQDFGVQPHCFIYIKDFKND